MLTKNSQSDYDSTKKAEYYDADGYSVADEANKNKLTRPEPIGSSENTEKE